MLNQRYDKTIEEKWQKNWDEKQTYKFDEKDTKKPVYSIDTPPPFTSGELHMGHVLSYSFIDFTARYKRMKGFNVFYPQGWDSQGFPTEVRVEKKYGRLPPVQFREKCVEWTNEMIERMRTQMQQMGFSADWNHQYITMKPDYHRKIQLSLTTMYKDKLIYRGKYPVFFCPRCSSAVAKSELEDEPKNGNLNYIKFTGAGKDLIIATTRPELMPACVAVLYNPTDERYTKLEGKMITTALGKEVPLIADKDVEKEFGTGLLMVCTYGDKMDVIWQHRHKLPLIELIDHHGKMQNAGELNGLKIEEARKKILELLGDKVVKKEQTSQTVKVHDRCKTPVELLASYQWFADIRSTAKRIKELAQKITWIPDFGISYLIDWVENAEWDWVISRQRVFGTPLPFYVCQKCGNTNSVDDLELPFYPEKAKGKKCECGEPMTPETSTCDCWVDSSITPMIIAGWPDNMERFSRLYPASLRPQGVEIVRTWAFYTIHRSGLLTHLPPFKSILLNGNVLAPDGKKMSKSLGNVISPTELLKDYPADSIRQWAAMSGAMAKDRPFSYEDIKYAKNFINKIWNAARLIENIVAKQKEEAAKTGEKIDRSEAKSPPELTTIDKWIIGRLNQTISEVDAHMEKFEFHYAITKIQRFFWSDFCDNYIEYVKHRAYGTGNTQTAALYTLRHVLRQTMLLLAPITPHLCEEISQAGFGEIKSVHHETYPKAGDTYEQECAKLAPFNEIVSQIRQQKAKGKLAQNAPLESVRISTPELLDEELLAELKEIAKIQKIENIKGELGVISITQGQQPS
ncbi:valine--tRNA ligase [Candidatus Micrarchaeota archaeon]|nr:valine--tRNA ligase [Candidatus Micrarchaeota archaeon]